MSGLWEFLGNISKHFNPEERKRRIKEQINELKRQEKVLLSTETATVKRSRKLSAIMRQLNRLQEKRNTY